MFVDMERQEKEEKSRKNGKAMADETLYFGEAGRGGEKEHHFVRRFPGFALSSF
jgi:hypothetical protein